jgi:hypothetical protein
MNYKLGIAKKYISLQLILKNYVEMDTITIIGIVLGATATLSTGIWFLNRKFFEVGKLSQRFDIIEKSYKKQEETIILIESSLTSIKESVKRLEEADKRQEESISKIPLIELRLGSIEESYKRQEAAISKIPLIELRLDSIEENYKRQEETLRSHGEALRIQGEALRSQGEALKIQGDTLKNQGEALRKIEENSKRQEDTVGALKDTSAITSAWIMKQDNSTISSFMGKKSPLSLTDTGKELLEVSGGKTLIDNNREFFLDKVGNFNPPTAFDVEEVSLIILISTSGKGYFKDIKEFVYYSREVTEFAGQKCKVDLNAVIFVMSVYLRDEYLKTYPFKNGFSND